MTDPEAEIAEVIEKRIEAIGAKDAEAVVQSLASDIASFEMVPPLVVPALHARDAAAAAAWLGGFDEIDVELRDLVPASADRS